VPPPGSADQVTLDESDTTAFLVVLEPMTPAERVELIQHDVFGYSFAEVAEITGFTQRRRPRRAPPDRRRGADGLRSECPIGGGT
jgi:RNA polymerase sigma-70 factor (ECF subfamily)